MPSKDWIEDSTHWWGRVLDGAFAHWCLDWDELPIDSTCMEIIACTCYDSPEFKAVQQVQQELFDADLQI